MLATAVLASWTWELRSARAKPASNSTARRLSLEDAVNLALRKSWDMKASRSGVEEAKAKRKATWMMWFPTLKVTGNALLWDDDLPFEVPPLDMEGVTMPAGCELLSDFTPCFSALMEQWNLGKIREQFTAQLSIQLVQPLTPLYSIYQLNRIDGLSVKMARRRLTGKEMSTRLEVTQAYLQAYQAKEYDQIMAEAEALVKAHAERVDNLLKEEMVRRAEQLKVEVKQAEVIQGRLRSRAAVSLARSNLARVLGLSISSPLILTERFADPPPPYPLTLEQCIARARKNRPEIHMARIGMDQARAGRAAKRWQLVPTVAAVAQFDANHGMGTIMPKTAFFVGAVMQWEFAWGKRWMESDVLTAKLHRAQALERKAFHGIPLQVKKHYLDLQVARSSIKVARAAVNAAQESHRIQTKRYEEHAASTTDVLDAQMELTKAKASYANALYSYYIARAALEAAMGGSK